MKIVLATPLYPPDIAEPAPYIKELARRLGAEHEVVVVTYGRLPERVPGVRVVAVDKRHTLFVRLLLYTIALWRESKKEAVVYAQSGASVELPAIVAAGRMLVWGASDARAAAHAQRSLLRGAIGRIVRSRAQQIIHNIPGARPEILPFAPRPERALAEWEEKWSAHVDNIKKELSHAHR